MQVLFTNKNSSLSYIVIGVKFGTLRYQSTAFVEGGYGLTYIPRKMSIKLFKDKKTGRPCLKLQGKKFFTALKSEDSLIDSDILNRADII